MNRGRVANVNSKIVNSFDIKLTNLNYTAQHSTCSDIDTILDKYKALFDGSLGLFKNYEASLRVKEASCSLDRDHSPMKDTIEKEIAKFVSLSVLEPVGHSEYSIVPILKKRWQCPNLRRF